MSRLRPTDTAFGLLDQLMGGENGTSLADWKPRVDVYQSDNDLVFDLEAPGLEKDDFDVELDGRRMTVKGERTSTSEESDEDRNYVRSERIYGAFKRTFTLPKRADLDNIQASYDDGVLTIKAPVQSDQSDDGRSIDID